MAIEQAIQPQVSFEDFADFLEKYRALSSFLDSLTPAGRQRREKAAAVPEPSPEP